MSTKAYKRYLLALLAVILAFNYVDRLVLGIVLQDIKAELLLRGHRAMRRTTKTCSSGPSR